MKTMLLCVILLSALAVASPALAMDVTLQWDPNQEADLAGYRLFYRTTSFTSSTPVPAQGATGWTIIDIPLSSLANPALPEKVVANIANVTTWFALTAYDNEVPSLQSTFSNVVQADPPLAPPVISTQPQNKTVTVGSPATFTLTATGTGITYQWQMRTSSTGIWSNVSTGTSPSYTTGATVAADNGKQFRCIVTNSGGTVTSNIVTLTVNIPPSVVKGLRIVSVQSAEGARSFQLVSDPVPGAQQFGVFVQGDDWRTVPYQEISYKGKQKALIKDLGTIPAQVGLYYKAIFPDGESNAEFLTIKKSTYVYDYPNSTSVLENAMWW